MEFDPHNNIIKLCLQGMDQENKSKTEEAGHIFLQAWTEASNDFEKYLAAYYVSRHQKNISGKLKWLETALQFALKVNNNSVKGAFASLYERIAQCYEDLNDRVNAGKNYEAADEFRNKLWDTGPFYHGTKADMKHGDLLVPGGKSNYKADLVMNHIYFTAQLNGAGLAAALAKGDGPERVYLVEPTGSFENDPNVTDKKFPGNPTRSYRTKEPLKVIAEVKEWLRITPEQLQVWREKLANNKGGIIN